MRTVDSSIEGYRPRMAVRLSQAPAVSDPGSTKFRVEDHYAVWAATGRQLMNLSLSDAGGNSEGERGYD